MGKMVPQNVPRKEHIKWGDHKGRLNRLYVKRNLPLPQVMTRMRDKYGFEATPKQYRYQLTHLWGWKKYNQPKGNREVTGDSSDTASDQDSEDGEEELNLLREQILYSDTHDVGFAGIANAVKDHACLRTCIRRCFQDFQDACRHDMMAADSQVSSGVSDLPEMTDACENTEICDSHGPLAVLLLGRMFESHASTSWWSMARRQINISPFYVLTTMTSLILTVAAHRLETDEGVETIEPFASQKHSNLRFAKIGVATIDNDSRERGRRLCWDDQTLTDEFLAQLRDLDRTPDYVCKLQDFIKLHQFPSIAGEPALGPHPTILDNDNLEHFEFLDDMNPEKMEIGAPWGICM